MKKTEALTTLNNGVDELKVQYTKTINIFLKMLFTNFRTKLFKN